MVSTKVDSSVEPENLRSRFTQPVSRATTSIDSSNNPCNNFVT